MGTASGVREGAHGKRDALRKRSFQDAVAAQRGRRVPPRA